MLQREYIQAAMTWVNQTMLECEYWLGCSLRFPMNAGNEWGRRFIGEFDGSDSLASSVVRTPTVTCLNLEREFFIFQTCNNIDNDAHTTEWEGYTQISYSHSYFESTGKGGSTCTNDNKPRFVSMSLALACDSIGGDTHATKYRRNQPRSQI